MGFYRIVYDKWTACYVLFLLCSTSKVADVNTFSLFLLSNNQTLQRSAAPRVSRHDRKSIVC